MAVDLQNINPDALSNVGSNINWAGMGVVGGLIVFALVFFAFIGLILWITSYKDTVYILKPIFKKDKGKLIRKKTGITEYKLLKSMFLKKMSIPPPSDDMAITSPKGKKIFYCLRVGEGQYHFLKFPNLDDEIKKITVIPSDMYNWLIWRAKATREKIMKPSLLTQLLLPVAIIIFIVMVSITFIYLFKNAPKEIAVSVSQCGTQMIEQSVGGL